MVDHGTNRVAHLGLGITAEAGEVADIIKKSQYARNAEKAFDKVHMCEELGDVLWYLTALADEMGVTLEDLALQNIAKLEKKHPERYNFDRMCFA